MINETQEIIDEFVNSGKWTEDMQGNKFFSQERVEEVIKLAYEMGRVSIPSFSAKDIALNDMKEFQEGDNEFYDDHMNFGTEI